MPEWFSARAVFGYSGLDQLKKVVIVSSNSASKNYLTVYRECP